MARAEHDRLRLPAWTQSTLLDGELATSEPRLLRYKLLHVAARITRGQRRVSLRLDAGWPWRTPWPPRMPDCKPCRY